MFFVITFKHDKVFLPGHEPEFDGNYFYAKTYNNTSFDMSQYNGEYSFDKITWYPFPDTSVPVSAYTTVYFRVDNPDGYVDVTPGILQFDEVGGNIVTLFNKYGIPGNYNMESLFYVKGNWNMGLVNAENLIIPSNYAHCPWMFRDCKELIKGPKILPATTLTKGCYAHMFAGCENLQTAPELPATILAEECYKHMFQGCTSLTSAPELPAANIPLSGGSALEGAYESMFRGCTSLNYVKCLATTGMVDGLTAPTGTLQWLTNVASTGTFVKAAEAEWPTGISGIPTGWTVKNEYTITFANWDGTTLQTIQVEEGQTPVYTGSTPTRPSDSQYNYTFNGWTPAITEATANTTYTATYTATEINVPNCVTFTAEEAGSTLGLVKLGSVHTLEYSRDAQSWSPMTIETSITLPNVSDKVYVRGILGYSDYPQFKMTGKIAASGNCNALWNYQDLEAPLKDYCGNGLFKDCTSLTQAPELPATTLAQGCYDSMFRGCTSLTQAPELPATTLTFGCYDSMFYGCTKLSTIKCLATDISATYALTRWTRGVASSGTFTKAAGVEWPTGTSGIPRDWTVVEV